MLKDLTKMDKNEKGRLPAAAALCFLLIFFLTASIVSAQIQITEIMYSLEGTDSGREWIEIFNSGTENADLNGWRLFDEAKGEEVSHSPIKTFPKGGSVILPADTYAVIVDKPDSFNEDWPNFSGIIFDGTFSLSEKSETLILKNVELEKVIEVTYQSEWGAKGDGNSLQKINGEWIPSFPTPGAPNSQSDDGNEDGGSDTPNEESDHPPLPNNSTPPLLSAIEPQIFAYIIPPTDVPIAGADFLFEAKAFGIEKEPLQNAEYQWTFGDGAKAKGQRVFRAYQYPSNYLVVLNVISGKYAASDRLKIEVIPSDITISNLNSEYLNQFIELHNPSSRELNLSWWRLKMDNTYFTIPKDTIILPNTYLKLASNITGLYPKQDSQADLLYPNGSVAFHYQKNEKVKANTSTPKNKVGSFEKTIDFVSTPTQIASIQTTTNLAKQISLNDEKNKNAILQDADTPSQNFTLLNSSVSATSSNLSDQIPSSQTKKNPLNKWTFSLAGIVSLAVIGVVFATKLDG